MTEKLGQIKPVYGILTDGGFPAQFPFVGFPVGRITSIQPVKKDVCQGREQHIFEGWSAVWLLVVEGSFNSLSRIHA
jgi:hypothetical protein